MNEEIAWHVELALKPGQLEDFLALTREMVKVTQTEAGVIIYERFASDDGRTIFVYERYADSAAAVAHLRTFMARFGERFSRTVNRKRFHVCGMPSDELKRILDQFDAVYCAPLAGFSRSHS